MKPYHKALLLVFVCCITSCKKKKCDPQETDDRSKTLTSLTELYDGVSSTYLLSYNTSGELATYQKQDGSELSEYTYKAGRIKTVTYKWDGKMYTMDLEHSASGMLLSGKFTTNNSNGMTDQLVLTCTQSGNRTFIETNNYFSLIVENDNLVSAEFNAWYYKRKITFAYSAKPAHLFGNNLYLPNTEIADPFTPRSNTMRIMIQMALQAFSKNELTAVTSGMFQRKLSYVRDAWGKVIRSETKIDKMDNGTALGTTYKHINYEYK